MRYLWLVVVLGCSSGEGGGAGGAQEDGTGGGDLGGTGGGRCSDNQFLRDTVLERMTGRFDNSAQVEAEPGHIARRLTVCWVQARELSDNVLYVESASVTPDAAVTQLVLAFGCAEGALPYSLAARAYRLVNPGSAGDPCAADLPAIDADQLQAEVPCDTGFTWNDVTGTVSSGLCVWAGAVEGDPVGGVSLTIRPDLVSWYQNEDPDGAAGGEVESSDLRRIAE